MGPIPLLNSRKTDRNGFLAGDSRQSMEWTGSIRRIHNPVQSRRIWIGLDQKFTNSADSGLDWIQKCAMCNVYPILRLEAVSPYRNSDV